jgi:hypothetical protein
LAQSLVLEFEEYNRQALKNTKGAAVMERELEGQYWSVKKKSSSIKLD